ncbi:MAG: protein kinase domain-containing protein [Isosphaeraceae bacterium]
MMEETKRCLGCGQARPVEAPGELCPICLMRTGAGDVAPSGSEPVRDDMLVTVGPASSSILATLAHTLGRVPQELLRTGPGAGASPSSALMPGPADLDRPDRLQLFEVIGRGGMGVVLKGYDTDLGRDLAVKVLREQYRDQPGMVRRFIEEAQIGGQLQHPGVVPVYELGTLTDRRPYIAMRLIRGQTLAELLAARADRDADRPRLLGIFESVCQTMAYAHARGVIHRDLQPSNIMVGSFGEVQVMDWGLAKVLNRADATEDEGGPAVRVESHESAVATARSWDGSDVSRPGSVMGTPAYMAPEQARGEVESLDERVDVFALGSILCEILTGNPAFSGGSPDEIERRAAGGEVADAHGRLDACGVDDELVGLAKECLSADPSGRPRDAREMARRITAYRACVQERLRAAELARVEAQARAEEEAKCRGLADRLAAQAVARAAEERRRRRLATALAASIVALVLVVGGGLSAFVYQRQAWRARVDVALRDAELLRDQAADDPDGDPGRWQAARAALRRLHDLRDAGPSAGLRERLEDLGAQIEGGSAAAAVDRKLVDRLEEIRGGMVTDDKADAAFAEAFGAAGFDLTSTTIEPGSIGRRLAGRPRSVALAAAVALDTWAVVRRGLARPGDPVGEASVRRLLAAARVADPDPWRNALRDSLPSADPAPLRRLAEDPELDRQGPVGLWLLGHGLEMAGDHVRALEVLRRAQRIYPGDYWLNTELGLALLEGTRSGLGATSSWVTSRGIPDERYQRAEPYFMAAVALRPQFGSAHLLLATAELNVGKWDETFRELREAQRLQPDDPTIPNCLGLALSAHGQPDEAAAAFREAIRLSPRYTLGYANLGELLLYQGKPDEAAAVIRDLIRLAPDYAPSHARLAQCLSALRRLDEAVAEYREAIRIAPQFALAHANLASVLRQRGDFVGASAEFRTAFELYSDPQWQSAIREELARTELRAALAPRLIAVADGKAQPRDAAETLEFAYLAHEQQRFAAASRLFDRAFAIEPKLAQDRNRSNRYNAACAAALAASGEGRDAPSLDKVARDRLRRQAHHLLKADLAALEPFRKGQPFERAQLQRTLSHWKVDTDLASLRSPQALAQLPEPDRRDWKALWDEVDSLLRSQNR